MPERPSEKDPQGESQNLESPAEIQVSTDDYLAPRPCRFCTAAWSPHVDAELCEFAHEQPVEVVGPLAQAIARMIHEVEPTDEQVGWFMEDADAVASDFDPKPDAWTVAKLPDEAGCVLSFEVNGVAYVVEDGEGHLTPVQREPWRKWRAEAERIPVRDQW